MKLSKGQWQKIIGIVISALLAIAAVMGWLLPVQVPEWEQPVARYETTVYREQGGDKLVVASGGEVEVQSGGTIDIQSGATTDFSSGVDLDGGLLDLDADGDTSIQANTDDQIDIEVSGADDFQFTANTLSALSGSTIEVNNISEETASSGVTVDDDFVVDDTFNIDDTDSTITGTQTITPTATFYELNPASTLTVTVATASAAVGDFLVLQNISAQSVIVVDTGATVGGGNVTLGQNDLVMFIYSNSKWIEIASPDNS